MKLALVALAACGGAQSAPESPKVDASTFAANALLDAIGKHDATAVAAMFGPTLTYGGLLFSDPSCTARFPVARTLADDERAEFAACLTTLPIVRSERKDALPNVVVLQYAPGIELEVEFGFNADTAWIEFVGYSGRHDLHDALPTITGAEMDVLRVGPRTAFSSTDAKTYEAMRQQIHAKELYVWLKVCADADGNITGVHARETSTLELVEPFTAIVKGWRLTGPFKFDGKPTPVCALERITYPDESNAEVLPVPLDDNNDVRVSAAVVAAHRTEGVKLVVPDDNEKRLLLTNHVSKTVGAFKLCIDEHGDVSSVTLIRSTGLLGYDEKIKQTLEQWKFDPFVANGVPRQMCSAITFIYSQR